MAFVRETRYIKDEPVYFAAEPELFIENVGAADIDYGTDSDTDDGTLSAGDSVTVVTGNYLVCPTGDGKITYRRAIKSSLESTGSVASAATITLPMVGVVTVTGTTTITSVTASYPGRIVILVFAGILTFTDGSNLTLAGDFVTTADDTITLTCDGTDWIEVSRSVN